MTSFYTILEPNFNTLSTIYAVLLIPSFAFLLPRVDNILRGRKWGGKNLTPASCGRREGPAAAGFTVDQGPT